MLLCRLENIYRYQFHREGVIAEIAKLAALAPPATTDAVAPWWSPPPPPPPPPDDAVARPTTTSGISTVAASDAADDSDEHEPVVGAGSGDGDLEDASDDEDDAEDADDYHDDTQDDITASPVSSRDSSTSSARHRDVDPVVTPIRDLVSLRAQRFMATHEHSAVGHEMRDKAAAILTNLCQLAGQIEACYLGDDHGAGYGDGLDLFVRLAAYFDGDALESITSAELLNSGIVQVLLKVFSTTHERAQAEGRAHFLQVFMGQTLATAGAAPPAKAPVTALSALVHKLRTC